jgi:membrane fusion protein, multidrug efflux system
MKLIGPDRKNAEIIGLGKDRIERAAAVLQQAQLNVQYTTILVPVRGIAGQRTVQPGQNVTPGQQLMTIVPLHGQNIWVTANFKETQLGHKHPGEPVKSYADTCGRTYDGHVHCRATGARYSLLPPENATGNYVKVETGQDPKHLLRPGMSVEPGVKVR